MLISNAYAQTSALASGSGFMEFLPVVAVCAVFYFLLLRPQQKRAKEQKTMLAALQKGDEIITVGGELGRVSKVGENYYSSDSEKCGSNGAAQGNDQVDLRYCNEPLSAVEISACSCCIYCGLGLHPA
jgi:preprotein translocase subunit YajC